MPSKFVRIQDVETELVINLEQIQSVLKKGDCVQIFFANDQRDHRLYGEAAKSFWSCLRGSTLTIHRAAHPAKNAETLAHKDFSA